MTLTAERVHAACAAWVFLSPGAPRVETDEYLLVRYPDWFEWPVQLVRFEPTRPAEEVLAEAIAAARQYVDPTKPATSKLACWLRLGADETAESAYVSAGGVLDETLDVLARPLTSADRELPKPDGLELRWSVDLDVMIDAAELVAEVFGGTATDREALVAEHPDESLKFRWGGGGAAVAYRDGKPVGSGGLTVVDGVARLWGGAVLPTERRRGIYGALLAARLAYACLADAEMALVKARVESSGPILRRAGFKAYGQERTYVIGISGPADAVD